MRLLVLCVAVLLLQSCRERPSGRGTDSPAVRASLAESTSAIAGGNDAAWQDPSCDTDTAQAHPSAGVLVREYLVRNDSLGFTTGASEENEAWLLGAAECPGHLGGTDGIVVVSSYGLDSLLAGIDSAQYLVSYHVIGGADPDGSGRWRFHAGQRLRLDTLVLVRSPYGWRIGGDPTDPLMSPSAIARRYEFSIPDRHMLDSIAQMGGRASRPGA